VRLLWVMLRRAAKTRGLAATTAGLLVLVGLAGVAPKPSDISPGMNVAATRPALLLAHPSSQPSHVEALVLYLPGISSYRRLDAKLLDGIVAVRPGARVEVYNWSAYNPGLSALLDFRRNQLEAAATARVIEAAFRADPGRPIYVIAHSGGAGILAWALEQLPAEVVIEQAVLLAPAVSPNYDLTRSLGHIRGNLYSFTSENDPVLGAGTRTMGTIDRVQIEAAGLRGFVRPEGADPTAYKRLIPMPWREEWRPLGHDGDHIGPLEPEFGRQVVAPLLIPAG
jgi:hypothetical protein